MKTKNRINKRINQLIKDQYEIIKKRNNTELRILKFIVIESTNQSPAQRPLQ